MDMTIIALYCLCDELLNHLHHPETPSRMSDAEVITTVVVSALYFSGHHEKSCQFMKAHGYIPQMLSKSRFNRRVQGLASVIRQLFQSLGRYWGKQSPSPLYIIDSFPIAVCDHKRIKRCQRFQGEEWRGYQASKQRYFYGLKVHLLVTEAGQPVECVFTEGSMSDVKALKLFDFDLPQNAEILGDKAYNDYHFEDQLAEVDLLLSPLRKSHSKRAIPAYITYWRSLKRKVVETTGSLLEQPMPKHIHSSTRLGFEIKLMTFMLALSFKFLLD